MSDNALVFAIVASITLGLVTCSVSSDWRTVEQEKTMLERAKVGIAKQ